MEQAKFEHLRIWQLAHKLMLVCHEIVNNLPYSEKSKIDQLHRSSESSPDNIAECVGAYYYNDKIKCLMVARKESVESQNHIISLRDKGYVSSDKTAEIIMEYETLITGINAYKKKIINSRDLYNNQKFIKKS